MLEELEELKEQKAVMESETKQIEIENQKIPNLKDKAIDQIKEDIRQTEHQISRTEKKKQEMNQDIQRVKVGLNALFSVLHSPLEKNQNPVDFINDENIEECLGKIEKKINFVMKMVKEAGLQELLVENVSDMSLKKGNNRQQMKGLEEFMSKDN